MSTHPFAFLMKLLHGKQWILACFTVLIFNFSGFSQCPVNIGFEDGAFTNWQCATGSVDTAGIVSLTNTGPLSNVHAILQNGYPQVLDGYGAFPVNCPNGSRYSVKLGNDTPNSQAHRLSYNFKVPEGLNIYSLIYNYAVVLQNPDHLPSQQPRFTTKIFDVANNEYISCSSFDFAASSSLPGFKQSSVLSTVYYKPWSPVTIKLDNLAGRMLRLEFTVHGCTVGGHFGYAYIDVNEDCTSPIQGNTYCIGAQNIRLTAPYGFKEYNWYNASFTNLLGSKNTLYFNPPPPAGTVFALEVVPFPGSGCRDTLYTTIRYEPVPFTLQVRDTIGACPPSLADLTLPDIKQGSSPGLRYTYFLDSAYMEYAPVPWVIDKDGIYYIKATNNVGCIDSRPVTVLLNFVPQFTVIDPPPAVDTTTVDITDISYVSNRNGVFSYTYWQDANATISLNNPAAISQSGVYYIKATNSSGCSTIKPIRVAFRPPTRNNYQPNVFSPNGDGINDTWQIPGLNLFPQCTVEIFDRYGQAVFRSTGYNVPWDGKKNGKPLPVGTYYYVIKTSSVQKPVTGSVTIIR